MKKAIFRFLGTISFITFLSQLSATRVDSFTPVYVGIASVIGVVVCFVISENAREQKGADEDGN